MAKSKKAAAKKPAEKATEPSRNQATQPERVERTAERGSRRKLPRREGVRVMHDQPAAHSAIKQEADQRAEQLEKQRSQRRKDRESAGSRQQQRAETRIRLTGDDTQYPRRK